MGNIPKAGLERAGSHPTNCSNSPEGIQPNGGPESAREEINARAGAYG